MALRDVDDLGAKTRSTEQRQWGGKGSSLELGGVQVASTHIGKYIFS